MRESVTVEEALALIEEKTPVLAEAEEVGLADALHRVLAEDVVALVSHPEVDNSAIDGYAARAADTVGASREHPVRLRVVGEAPAGKPYPGRVGPGEAVAIYTGAALPEGTDAVVAVEDTRREGDLVLLFAPASPKDIRPAGDDYKKGEVVLKKGTFLTPGRIGLAAGAGHARLKVARKPKVAILSTGDEVAEPGEPLPPGGVYNSNSYAVAGLVVEAGGTPVLLGRVPDEQDALREKLTAGGHDLVVTTGGVSMGAYDLVRKLLEDEGEVYFWKIKQRPGGPPVFARLGETLVFGLPGNPVSAMVVFFLYLRPMLFKMLGRTDPPYRRVQAIAADPFKGAGVKTAFRRAVLEYDPEVFGGFVAHTTGNQSSGVLKSMALANALVVVPPDSQVAPGAEVESIVLRPEELGGA
jgi:molybdopterin molybdotransferase